MPRRSKRKLEEVQKEDAKTTVNALLRGEQRARPSVKLTKRRRIVSRRRRQTQETGVSETNSAKKPKPKRTSYQSSELTSLLHSSSDTEEKDPSDASARASAQTPKRRLRKRGSPQPSVLDSTNPLDTGTDGSRTSSARLSEKLATKRRSQRAAVTKHTRGKAAKRRRRDATRAVRSSAEDSGERRTERRKRRRTDSYLETVVATPTLSDSETEEGAQDSKRVQLTKKKLKARKGARMKSKKRNARRVSASIALSSSSEEETADCSGNEADVSTNKSLATAKSVTHTPKVTDSVSKRQKWRRKSLLRDSVSPSIEPKTPRSKILLDSDSEDSGEESSSPMAWKSPYSMLPQTAASPREDQFSGSLTRKRLSPIRPSLKVSPRKQLPANGVTHKPQVSSAGWSLFSGLDPSKLFGAEKSFEGVSPIGSTHTPLRRMRRETTGVPLSPSIRSSGFTPLRRRRLSTTRPVPNGSSAPKASRMRRPQSSAMPKPVKGSGGSDEKCKLPPTISSNTPLKSFGCRIVETMERIKSRLKAAVYNALRMLQNFVLTLVIVAVLYFAIRTLLSSGSLLSLVAFVLRKTESPRMVDSYSGNFCDFWPAMGRSLDSAAHGCLQCPDGGTCLHGVVHCDTDSAMVFDSVAGRCVRNPQKIRALLSDMELSAYSYLTQVFGHWQCSSLKNMEKGFYSQPPQRRQSKSGAKSGDVRATAMYTLKSNDLALNSEDKDANDEVLQKQLEAIWLQTSGVRKVFRLSMNDAVSKKKTPWVTVEHLKNRLMDELSVQSGSLLFEDAWDSFMRNASQSTFSRFGRGVYGARNRWPYDRFRYQIARASIRSRDGYKAVSCHVLYLLYTQLSRIVFVASLLSLASVLWLQRKKRLFVERKANASKDAVLRYLAEVRQNGAGFASRRRIRTAVLGEFHMPESTAFARKSRRPPAKLATDTRKPRFGCPPMCNSFFRWLWFVATCRCCFLEGHWQSDSAMKATIWLTVLKLIQTDCSVQESLRRIGGMDEISWKLSTAAK